MLPQVVRVLEGQGLNPTDQEHSYIENVIQLIKDRCTLLSDFALQAGYFFAAPAKFDLPAVKGKWNEAKKNYFEAYAAAFPENSSAADLETLFKQLAEEHGLKPGELMLPFRIMLVGGKFGPAVFDIASLLGKSETQNRIHIALGEFQEL